VTAAAKQALSSQVLGQISSGLDYGNWSIEEKIALSCNILAKEGHSETLAGQITVRQPDGSFLTTPLAHGFDEISAASVIRINDNWKYWKVPAPPIRPSVFICGYTSDGRM